MLQRSTFRSIAITLICLLLGVTHSYGHPPLSNVPYRELKGYFVKNTFKGKLTNPKIANKRQFDRIFGMAATMGKGGQPTPVNFRKQYVIAVITPKTRQAITLMPRRLEKNVYGRLRFYVDMLTGNTQTFTTSPCLLIAVDRQHNGPVTLELSKVKSE